MRIHPAVPLLLLAGLALSLDLGDDVYGPLDDSNLSPAPYPAPWDRLAWVFPDGPTHANAALLALDPSARMPGDATRAVAGHNATLRREEPTLALVTVRADPDAATPPDARDLSWLPRPAPPGPRLLVDGRDAARLQLYIFDDTGSLLGTNTNDTRFGRPGVTLPASVWHLGTGPAPNGTAPVPDAARPYLLAHRDLLEGLPAGGVTSMRIDDHPYAGLIGPVYVTLRVEAIPE